MENYIVAMTPKIGKNIYVYQIRLFDDDLNNNQYWYDKNKDNMQISRIERIKLSKDLFSQYLIHLKSFNCD